VLPHWSKVIVVFRKLVRDEVAAGKKSSRHTLRLPAATISRGSRQRRTASTYGTLQPQLKRPAQELGL